MDLSQCGVVQIEVGTHCFKGARIPTGSHVRLTALSPICAFFPEPDVPMKLLKIVAAGAASYFAFRAWKRNRDEQPMALQQDARALPDDGARTTPHGDALIADEDLDTSVPRSTSHSSPGFGAP